jgi:phosphoribosyl-AMP cyclohydrolase
MPETELATLLDAIQFDSTGLVPVIAQAQDGGEILMMAWMNRAAVAETLTTGRVCYWSRSRQSLWRKGETSGQRQHLIELRLDCDGDCLLVVVVQEGVACHTGRRSCFFNRAATGSGTWEITSQPLISPQDLYSSGVSTE